MSYAALLFLAVSVCVVGACSRERSRLARFVLDSHFFPLLLQWEGRLTDHCPFRRSRDIYYDQERHKTEKDARHWTCELCGKSFYSEHYLDAHMERKHAERMVTENGVCLADYCDVLRCHAVQHKGQKQAPDSCSENEMLRLRAKCQTIVNKCIDSSSRGSAYPLQLYNALDKEVCGQLTCQKFWDPVGDKSWRWWSYVLIFIVVALFLILITAVFTDPFSEGDAHREHSKKAYYVHHPSSYSRHSNTSRRRRHTCEDR